MGDHHRAVDLASPPPVRHELAPHAVSLLAGHDSATRLVAPDRLVSVSPTEHSERLPLPRGALTPILAQLDHRQPHRQRPERPAGADLRQWRSSPTSTNFARARSTCSTSSERTRVGTIPA